MRNPDLERRLRKIVAEFPEVLDAHEFHFKKVRDRLYVSCHCTLPDDMQLSRVHDVQTALEIRFKHDMQIYGVHNLPVAWSSPGAARAR